MIENESSDLVSFGFLLLGELAQYHWVALAPNHLGKDIFTDDGGCLHILGMRYGRKVAVLIEVVGVFMYHEPFDLLSHEIIAGLVLIEDALVNGNLVGFKVEC